MTTIIVTTTIRGVKPTSVPPDRRTRLEILIRNMKAKEGKKPSLFRLSEKALKRIHEEYITEPGKNRAKFRLVLLNVSEIHII
jgi:hypothetical protein